MENALLTKTGTSFMILARTIIKLGEELNTCNVIGFANIIGCKLCSKNLKQFLFPNTMDD